MNLKLTRFEESTSKKITALRLFRDSLTFKEISKKMRISPSYACLLVQEGLLLENKFKKEANDS